MKFISVFFRILFLEEKASKKFAVTVTLGLAFSIAVILSTIGIMDGFGHVMREGLRKSTGDIVLYWGKGFFSYNKVLPVLKELKVNAISPHIQTEGFIVHHETSKGILLKGVRPQEFSKVTGLALSLEPEEAVLGMGLAKTLKVKKGDDIVIALAGGNRTVSGMPSLQRFKVRGVIDHGIYEKNMRLVYVNLDELQSGIHSEGKINVVSLNIPEERLKVFRKGNRQLAIDDFIFDMEERLQFEYIVKPFWRDFQDLFEAVEDQKKYIGIILQLIVVISIFNVLAFVSFFNEKRAREIFLFKAMGMNQKQLNRIWFLFMMGIWALSCLLSIGLVFVFNLGLKYLPLFELPGEVYGLSRLQIHIDLLDYGLVFGVALAWIILLSLIVLYRLRVRPILYGLRKEFT